ncbi:alcohol dehydrogenase catalytic domain-containing protein [Streptomyces sp. AHU1]|uniref:alcohol dehydrogenase catalytic domain-containing protein n=1 Tax=Streptomyces sp. AHU1 TaxID=3377215 RepID=UPI00387836C1
MSTVRALVHHGPGQSSWDTVPDPVIEEATDAIVRVDATTVCGGDLRILRGDLPEAKPGTVLGHEGVEAGPGVHHLRSGNQVIVSAVSACGHCRECRDTTFGRCGAGGG